MCVSSMLCLGILYYILIQPLSLWTSSGFWRTLSRCQFNSHSRRGVHGERIEPREELQRVFRWEGWIGLAESVSTVVDIEKARMGHVLSAIPFVCLLTSPSVIISGWIMIRYSNINSVLISCLSLYLFYKTQKKKIKIREKIYIQKVKRK